jgi:rare lipoprotein A
MRWVAFFVIGRQGFGISVVRALKIAPFCLIALWLVGCAGPEVIVQPGNPPALFNNEPVATYEGKASYYWKPQPTASGERFDPEAMTAAHKTLPFQTMVRVTNLRNGKSCLVRITDRGPFIRGRIIDLSLAAAREVNMIKSGVVPVRVDVLRPIEVVEKPNLRLTSQVRSRGETMAREEEEEAAARLKSKPERASGEDRARSRRTRRF